MKKSEKRRIGEARQAENLRQSIESGLKAQTQAHAIAAKRKATMEKIAQKKSAEKASNAMRALGESASRASKSMSELVTQMANEGDQIDLGDETTLAG